MSAYESKAIDREFQFTHADFMRIRELIHTHAGISLSETKSEMVYGRIGRILRNSGQRSFKDYLDKLQSTNDPKLWEEFTNALTTNLTSFFREGHHFPILSDHLKQLRGEITIWCCAASTGEEPYSIAMTACEAFNTITPPVKIIATDIDTNVLETASAGIYPIDRISKLTNYQREQFFLRGTGRQEGAVRVRPEVRKLITFKPFNLLSPRWEFSKPFDAIFCRNVMIYFDKPTQAGILSKIAPLMHPHSLAFFGHSENFLYLTDEFKLCGKTVYKLNK